MTTFHYEVSLFQKQAFTQNSNGVYYELVKQTIPQPVLDIAAALAAGGFEAYLVGGCVRDLILGREPKDWDIATNARPEEIQKACPDSVYENEFGTVLVKLGPRTGAERTRTGADGELLYADVSYKIRGCAFSVKKNIGLGHKENVYQNALGVEFVKVGLGFEKEKVINVVYEGKKIGNYRPDFVIEEKIIVEIKALPFIGVVEEKQLWSYLKGSEYKLGLLVNFGGKDVEIRRVVYDTARVPRESALGPRESARVVEVTTYRVDGAYRDHRHPEEVQFAARIEDDLARRDFTVNALALSIPEGMALEVGKEKKEKRKMSGDEESTIVDPFDGRTDLAAKVIRAVGNPTIRFREDALRLLRAVRFAAELGFTIDDATGQAIQAEARLLEEIAPERIRDELVKLILAPRAAVGIRMLEVYGLLTYIIPELREGIGCGQNKHHIYTVFDHNVRALAYTAEKGYPLHIRLGALLHDVGKPRTKRGDGPDSTFYNHEVVGGRMARIIMERLKFSVEVADAVTHLVRQHLFYYNVGEVSAAGVRRFIARVGIEMVDDILKVREADRIGSGVPKAFPYKLRHLQFMIDKVRHDPVHPKMLALRGDELMRLLGVPAGPVVGQVLRILLDEVLEEPSRNAKGHLEGRAKELAALSPADIAALDRAARSHVEELEQDAEEVLKRRHHVS